MNEVRLIDANALKYKNLAEVNGRLTYVLTAEEIDNAPTVEITKPQSYCMGFADGLAAQNYEKPPMFERPQGEWIPVSERLPKEYCLFCDIDGDVFYGHIYDGRWWAKGQDDRIKNVVAWMPLPEPYMKGGAE